MLDNIRDTLNQVSDLKTAMKFDPSKFNDPIAEKIDWRMIGRGGTNFTTHKLKTDGMNRAEFKPTIWVKLFSLLFIAIGVGFLIYWIPEQMQGGFTLDGETIMGFVFAAIFAGVGIIFYMKFRKPMVFDKTLSAYWKGSKEPTHKGDIHSIEDGVSLDDIHALQMLRRYKRSNKNNRKGSRSGSRGYYIYEINLVLKDATRHHVLSHGGRKQIHRDAKELASFLDVPLWSVT